MVRVALAVITAMTALLGAPGAAVAHFKDKNNKWAFYGRTYNAPQQGQGEKKDPLNVFFYPQAPTRASVERHVKEHWRPGWHTEDEMTKRGPCHGSQYVDFRDRSDRRVREDFQGVGFRNVVGIPQADDCYNRYHSRNWGDANAHSGDYDHPPSRAWVVAGYHYDRVTVVVKDIDRNCFGIPTQDRLDKCLKASVPGHKTGMDWDEVEVDARNKMNRQRNADHRDNAGRTGGHCFTPAYSNGRLPGSYGMFGYPAKHSDGKLTRISMNHCPR